MPPVGVREGPEWLNATGGCATLVEECPATKPGSTRQYDFVQSSTILYKTHLDVAKEIAIVRERFRKPKGDRAGTHPGSGVVLGQSYRASRWGWRDMIHRQPLTAKEFVQLTASSSRCWRIIIPPTSGMTAASRSEVRMGKMQIIPAAFRAGMSRVEASEYVGVSATLFDEMVRDGRMPSARRANSRMIWLRHELDAALVALPLADGSKPLLADVCSAAEHGVTDDEKFWGRVA